MGEAPSGLNGRPLALAALRVCQRLDPDQKGLKPQVIEQALIADEVRISGENPRATLNSTLNHHQDLFKGGPDYTWIWTNQSYDPARGLSGAALAEEAYRIMSLHDTGRVGMHYGSILEALLADGVEIRGGNRGNTLFTALQNSDMFEWISSGTFRVRR